MTEARGIGGLSGRLLKIAHDPHQVAELYEILGEFCHKYRNRLNNLKLGLYLARQAETGDLSRWKGAEATYNLLESTIDQIQCLCRPLGLEPICSDLGLFLDDRRRVWTDLGLRLDWQAPRSPVVVHFDPSRLGAAFDAWAESRLGEQTEDSIVRVTWKASRGQVRFDWEELGEVAAIASDDFSLPILVRVIAGHGGSAQISTENGVRLSLRWPTGNRSERSRPA